MDFIKAVKNLIAQNIPIPIGAVIFGIFLLKLLDSSIIIKIFCRSLPNLISNLIENFFVAGGLLWLLFGSFGMFLIWMNAYNWKRLAGEKICHATGGVNNKLELRRISKVWSVISFG